MMEPSGRIFPALKSRPFETWQVGAVRLPIWVPRSDGGDPFRGWIACCLALDSERIMTSDPGPEEEISALLESAVSRAGRKWRSRPERVQVADAAWAGALEGLLSPHGVAVEVRPELLEVGRILESLRLRVALDDPRPGPLAGAGVTLERLAAFARAAAGFLEASGWRHLNHEDRVRIEAPDVEAELRCFSLLHHGAKPAPVLSFFAEAGEDLFPDPELDDDYDEDGGDEDDDDDEEGGWTVALLKPWTASPTEVDLWEEHGLPWAGDRLIPVAGRWRGGIFQRPDHRQLALFEGLFAALTELTEGDLDTGPWETRVSTAEGPVRFVLSLPDMLEPPEEDPVPLFTWRFLARSMERMQLRGVLADGEAPPAGPAEPETPEERAEAVLDRAYGSLGRRSVLLARQALEIWPDCVDAYNLLAGRAPDPEFAGQLYELGMAAGERELGPELFAADADVADHAGHFWGLPETRPYMRARQGLAETLIERRRFTEAAEHLQGMLRLNPGDNQRVRHSLVNLLIALDRDDEAQALADRYAWDTTALLEYPRALLRFRREGDSLGARRSLKKALQANRFVPGILLRTRGITPPTHLFSPKGEDEASLYFVFACETWPGTPGAIDWLRQRTKPPARAKKSTAKKRKKKRR